MQTAIVPGSLQAIAQSHGQSIAESFVGADVIVIVDVSGSMDANDSRGGHTRYEVACEELANLQANLPGKIAVLAFSDCTMFCPNGKPHFMGLGTNLATALRFAKVADLPGMRFFVISDGLPDNESEALAVAAQYKSRIDCIFVGPETDSFARKFMGKLATANGGKSVTADRAKELAPTIEKLLLNEGE